MSDFHTIAGFEDVWRPPVRPRRRTPETLLGVHPSDGGAKARLTRLVNRAPEVMVKVTGRTRDRAGLRAHLDYISRNGGLVTEDRDGARLISRADLADKAEAWEASAAMDRRRRSDTPLSHSIMLSMPTGTDPFKVRDAARAFAAHLFAGERDYVFTLHTDTPRPHVHLAVCSRGDNGERLNPRRGDLELWRQTFAQALRDRGIEAEATPRRARGVTRKAERAPLRRIRERAEAGQGAPSTTLRSAYREAARAAFLSPEARPAWETRLLDRQSRIRTLYMQQAALLRRSSDPRDQTLGAEVEAFVRAMPAPDSQRLALARALRTASAERDQPPGNERPERGR